METAHLIMVALAGLCIGSFLNVVIWRLPRGENLSRPRSHCPGCNRLIAWYDNVPLLSWALLRGRCRGCKTRISIRYPLVEVVTGILFVLAWKHWPGEPVTALLVGALLAALLAISLIDWEYKIIPDAITKPGIVIAVLLAPLTSLHPTAWLASMKPAPNAWLHAALGALVGALVILVIRWIGGWITGKEAMGLGDVKLMALIGAFVGPLGVVYTLVIASLAGSVIGILRLVWARSRPLVFPLRIRGKDLELTFDRARIVGEAIRPPAEADASKGPTPGAKVEVLMTLPAAGILEDDDAEVTVEGVVESVPGDESAWQVKVLEASDEDRERLDLFAASLKYVPFGPFLALGATAMLLFGPSVEWLVREGWPTFARGLFS